MISRVCKRQVERSLVIRARGDEQRHGRVSYYFAGCETSRRMRASWEQLLLSACAIA